jgi:hypothetical protein
MVEKAGSKAQWYTDPDLRARAEEARNANGRGSWEIPNPASLCLSAKAWLARDIPPPDFVLGEVLSTEVRALLVANTGIGKTMLCLAMAYAMAGGRDFLGWRASRKARVLYIDGEMSKGLMQARIADAALRIGADSVPDTLFILCRDDLDEMPPLNSGDGQAFIDKVIEQIGGVDFIFFDNVQSLLLGDMKDEQSWQETLPWVRSLTKRRIGQLWVHHTGHDLTRSYGTKTREWQLDTVILLEKVDRPERDVAFQLSFTKARQRARHNRADFGAVTITLDGDGWHCEGGEFKPSKIKPPSPLAVKFYRALVAAIDTDGAASAKTENKPAVSYERWQQQCIEAGLIDADTKRASSRALMSQYRRELIGANWIKCANASAWSIK